MYVCIVQLRRPLRFSRDTGKRGCAPQRKEALRKTDGDRSGGQKHHATMDFSSITSALGLGGECAGESAMRCGAHLASILSALWVCPSCRHEPSQAEVRELDDEIGYSIHVLFNELLGVHLTSTPPRLSLVSAPLPSAAPTPGEFSTPVGALIEQATSESLINTDWALNLQICDEVSCSCWCILVWYSSWAAILW